MKYSIIEDILSKKGITKKYLLEKIGMSRQGLNTTLKNETLKIRDLEKIAAILGVPVGIFFNESQAQNFFSEGDNSPISIGSTVTQKGDFGNKKAYNTETEVKLLREKIEGYEKQLALKDEIIEILKNR